MRDDVKMREDIKILLLPVVMCGVCVEQNGRSLVRTKMAAKSLFYGFMKWQQIIVNDGSSLTRVNFVQI